MLNRIKFVDATIFVVMDLLKLTAYVIKIRISKRRSFGQDLVSDER